MAKKILLMYISDYSGHQQACFALENALHLLDKDVETKCINSFSYTNPILEKIINKTYMTVIKRRPEVWEYLYDNPRIVKKSQRLKELMHRYNSGKMKELLDSFKPDAIVCTQAFPCGIVADLKKTHGIKIPLIGVLTDYAPHSYWVYNSVDVYIVPSEETGKRLVQNGVFEGKIRPLGVPVDPKFYRPFDKQQLLSKYSLESDKPVLLIMGGSQGLGPIKRIVMLLNKSPLDVQLIILTGTNKKMYRYLRRRRKIFKKNIVVLPFTDAVNELMEIATLIITKPGGLTTAEALSKNLPIIIIHPLPGQESMNTQFLTEKGFAIKAGDEREVVVLLEELLRNQEKIAGIKKLMREHNKPYTSLEAAKLILEMAY